MPAARHLTEFGSTPLFTIDELRSAGIAIALSPLSAFRAMNRTALNVYEVYEAVRRDGTQRGVVDAMETRAELYEVLAYERCLKIGLHRLL